MISQLMIGVLLIAAGILLAVVAYLVISGSRSAKKPESADEVNGEEGPGAVVTETGVPDPLTLDNEEFSDDIPDLPDDIQTSTEQDALETRDEIAPEDSKSVPEAGSLAEGEDEEEQAGKPDFEPQAGPRIPRILNMKFTRRLAKPGHRKNAGQKMPFDFLTARRQKLPE